MSLTCRNTTLKYDSVLLEDGILTYLFDEPTPPTAKSPHSLAKSDMHGRLHTVRPNVNPSTLWVRLAIEHA
eukprot:CAMPEP_0183359650 /NCGR_PEP_ID=MMETSP0164_2-20130417/52907_1 /TAXON_ID=221442 /ORGANISM="Coccolithus pelagicus ssp braarudi, Strain PLY182g" /LENGTH=70 /DNA_ID=CAMNT_0025533827 /DNA_START=179 /DNA_END=391 /DNA_ORIENTATION=-